MDSSFTSMLTAAARLISEGDLIGAQDNITSALKASPTHPTALHVQGLIFYLQGRLREAIEYINEAVTYDGTQAIFFSNLCLILNASNRHAEAQAAGERAVELDSSNPHNLNTLANVFVATNRYESALRLFERIHSIEPRHVNALTQGIMCAGRIGDFSAVLSWQHRIAHFLKNFDPTTPTLDYSLTDLCNMAYLDVISPLPEEGFAKVCRAIDSLLQALPSPVPEIPATPSKRDRMRIGYLSAHFGDHPIGHVSQAIFHSHDRSLCEIHVFSLRSRDAETSGHAKIIKEGCDFFYDCSQMSPHDAAELFRSLSIDILVYLDGFMSPSGLSIVAHKPAAFHIFWLGHAGNLPLSCIDAIVADDIVLPPNTLATTQKTIRLSGCYHCASPQPVSDYLDPILHGRTSASLTKPFVFCGFNNTEKIDAKVFDVWMEILRGAPLSLLWLSNQFRSCELEHNLRTEAQVRGVDPNRLVFAERLPSKNDHLGRHRQADLFLDTFSLTASTTALDALWTGLPLLTVQGDRFSSRISSTFLTSLGLSDLICHDIPTYIQRAITVASNPEMLVDLRHRLATALSTSDLFNSVAFTRNLEQSLLRHALRVLPD